MIETTPTRSADAVTVTGVDKVFSTGKGEVRALDGIDLTVGAGEFVSLIGPSGCGKSTLLRLIADLDEPTAGEIRVFGKTGKPGAGRPGLRHRLPAGGPAAVADGRGQHRAAPRTAQGGRRPARARGSRS